jgi:asparagine synthase (glutamine-hydrolysing)
LCGIAGIWSQKDLDQKDYQTVDGMVKSIEKRGPDFQDIVTIPKAVLGHVRLSIIDTSSDSNQPMSDQSGQFWLVFNGEVYNYKSLRSDLISKYSFEPKTNGDTEVLLHGLIFEGADFLKKVNGFFAFGFVDIRENTILLGRDRFGIKPMYYSQTSEKLVFGSSLQAVSYGLSKKEIDFESLSKYLQYSYIPAPDTMIKGIYKLEPGHTLSVNASGLEKKCFYEIPQTSDSDGVNIDKQFIELLTQSVSDRLIADVPVGAFLSGGYDSTLITSIAKELKSDIPAFSIGFPDNAFFDESEKARVVAKHLGVEHHVIPVSNQKIDDAIQDVFEALDEPFADSSAVLVNILSQYTRQHVKVALSGDGADELMGGYNKHKALLQSVADTKLNKVLKPLEPVFRHLPESRNSRLLNEIRKAKRYIDGLALSYNERYDAWASFTKKSMVAELLQSPLHIPTPNHLVSETDFNSVLRADMKQVLSNDMLTKVDLMSMYHGLEVRVPFLDHRMVDFLFKLPAHQKLNIHQGKLLVKNALHNRIPESLMEKGKKGFEAPLAHWFKGPLKEMLSTYLSKTKLEQQGIFNSRAVQRLEEKAISRNAGDAPNTLWAVLVFQVWYDRNFK